MEKSNSTKGNVRYSDYSLERVMALKRIVERNSHNQKHKRYSILVDEEMVVAITSDPQEFEDYLQFVESFTTQIEVRLYFGNSPHHNKHIFRTDHHGLSGVNLSTKAAEDKKLWELEINAKKYKKKAQKYRRKLEAVSQELEELAFENQELADKTSTKNILTEIIAGIKSGGLSKGMESQGVNQPVGEVEIEGLDEDAGASETALKFDQLMQEFKITNSKTVLRMVSTLVQYPDLQKIVLQRAMEVKQQNKNNG